MLQELRYALRQLMRTPRFAATVVATLTLAIGIAVAAFSVLYAVLIRPLPYRQPDRIVSLEGYSPSVRNQPASYPEYLEWRNQNHVFEALAGVTTVPANFEGPSGPIALENVSGTDNFFDVFGVNALLGRTFLPGEDQAGRNDVAVLSHELWQQHFGSGNALGQRIKLDGHTYTVIGVMPAGFRYPLQVRNAIYTPLHLSPQQLTDSRGQWLPTVARLKPGVSLKQAEADLNTVLQNLSDANRAMKGRRVALQDMSSAVSGGVADPLRVLVLAVLAVLATGCANVAGLLLARGVKREKEMALRAALGADRWKIVRQLLTETLVLCLTGAVGGTLLAYGLLNATRPLLVRALVRGTDVQIDMTALAAAFGLAVLSTLFAGVLPALRLSGIAPNLALKASGGAGSARGQHHLRSAFVSTQVAFAFALLIASGLMLRTLSDLRNTDLGFETDHVLTTEISLSPASYEGRDVISSFYAPLLERVRAIPGVTAAGVTYLLPTTQRNWGEIVHIAGQPPDPPERRRMATFRMVSPGYFEALGLSLVRGRMLDERIDTAAAGPSAVLVNETFARTFFPNGEEPLGKRLDSGEEIVGVVRSVRQNLRKQPRLEINRLITQVPAEDRLDALSNLYLVIRTSGNPESITPSLRRIFYDLDPGLPFRTPQTMPEIVDSSLQLERLQNWAFGTFAALALTLAVVGLYALISQDVELSTRDIGVCKALGASRLRVLSGIYRRVAIMLLCGVTAGLLATLMLKKVLAAVVLISPARDAGMIACLAAGLVLAGLLAAFAPACRAASTDPMVALRYE
jgi:predicted permease